MLAQSIFFGFLAFVFFASFLLINVYFGKSTFWNKTWFKDPMPIFFVPFFIVFISFTDSFRLIYNNVLTKNNLILIIYGLIILVLASLFKVGLGKKLSVRWLAVPLMVILAIIAVCGFIVFFDQSTRDYFLLTLSIFLSLLAGIMVWISYKDVPLPPIPSRNK